MTAFAEQLARLRPHRGELHAAWWRLLGGLGLPESRWRAWDPMVRRAVIAGVTGLVIVLVFMPISGFSLAAFLTYLVFVVLYVPSWQGVPYVGRWIPAGGVLAVAIAFPYFNFKMFTIPILGAFPDTHTGVVMLIYTMMALGLNVVVGYAGLLDLGYVAFFAMGAYTTAWLASQQFGNYFPRGIFFGSVDVFPHQSGFHVSIWLLLILGGVLTSIIGVIIGLPTLRLRGDYLAIVTLGFGEILPQVFRNGDNFFNSGFNLTNGPQGIVPVDALGFGHTIQNAIGLPANFLTVDPGKFGPTNGAAGDTAFYWTAIFLVLITIFVSARLRDSRLGRAWVAIREDETAAAAMGVPLMRTKTWSYAIGAFFGGVAGAYFAAFTGGANPSSFFFNISVTILCMVILGGMGNIWGVIFGACFLAYLDQAGLANTGAWLGDHLGINIDVPKYEFGIYGVILLVVMLFRPEGMIPSSRRKREFREGVHDRPLVDEAE